MLGEYPDTGYILGLSAVGWLLVSVSFSSSCAQTAEPETDTFGKLVIVSFGSGTLVPLSFFCDVPFSFRWLDESFEHSGWFLLHAHSCRFLTPEFAVVRAACLEVGT